MMATRVNKGAADIEAEPFVLHPITFTRGSLSLAATLNTIAALRRVRREVQPTLTYHVALHACVLGMIAALSRRSLCVNAFIRMGYSFTANTAKARALRLILGATLRILFNRQDNIARC